MRDPVGYDVHLHTVGKTIVNPRLQKLALDWKTYVALVAAVGMAMSALTATVKGAADTVSVFKGLPTEARWFVAAVFLVLTVVFLLAALSRRSILLEPKRFLLSSENPDHLVGREEEMAHLARQCERHRMVFLVGDSGTGKSSLARAGLAHGLLAEDSTLTGHDFVPLVVDLSGVGWQRGLSLALARGLGKLPEDAWQALGGGERPAADAVFRWLRIRPAHAPRRLLLILDQFDDYLSVHRSQFYEETTLRRPREIEARNTDWHGLAELLRSGSVNVLVVARSEAAGSLPALCFVEDAAIAREHLTRLPGNLVAPLLHRLSEPLNGQPVVSDPEFGWFQLRSRLLRDLQAAGEGQILPIQLAVALNSLRLSRYLTPAEYERQGGLRGLERLHVERHVEKAAKAANVPATAVLEALLIMVSPDGAKTRPVSRADFDHVLGRHGATPEAAERAILQLEDDRLLRRVLGDGAEAETLLLYHDYLARGVREAYRQANRWSELLRERAQLFQEAVGWRQNWRALLTPVEQARLLWERLRGRFSFAEELRFFGLSTARWLPIALALFLVGAGGWGADRYRKNQIAAEVMQAIGHAPYMREEEARQLLRLSAAGRDAVTHALCLAIGDAATAVRASERVDQLASLAVGLDPHGERSRDLLEEIVEPAIENTQVDSGSAVAFAAMLASKIHLAPSTVRKIAKSITSRMKTEASSDTLARLGEALGSLSAKVERQDVAPAAAALVKRMKTAPDSFMLYELGSALGALSPKLERQDVAFGAAALVERMKTEPDGFVLSQLGAALGSLSPKLERKDVALGAKVLAARLKTETDRTSLTALGAALGSLSPKLERQDIAPIATVLVARMRIETDRGTLLLLGRALNSLCAKFERQYIVQAVSVLVARMTTEADSDNLANLGWALGSFRTRLERQHIARAAAVLVARMKTEKDTDSLMNLGWTLGSLSTKLEGQDVAHGAAVLAARMKTETNPVALDRLKQTLASISMRLKIERGGVPAFEELVTNTVRASDRNELNWFTRELVDLRATLPNPVSLSIYPHPVRIEQVYVDLLKSPLLVGDARAELLKGLEKAAGQTFSGDLWSFVDWATNTDAGRALKLDLEGPPPWSGAGGE